MAPAAVVEDDPERILVHRPEISDDVNEDVLDLLIEEGACEVVMVDEVVPLLGTEDHRDHMAAEEIRPLARRHLPPMPALFRHLAEAHGDLGGMELRDRYRLEARLS